MVVTTSEFQAEESVSFRRLKWQISHRSWRTNTMPALNSVNSWSASKLAVDRGVGPMTLPVVTLAGKQAVAVVAAKEAAVGSQKPPANRTANLHKSSAETTRGLPINLKNKF